MANKEESEEGVATFNVPLLSRLWSFFSLGIRRDHHQYPSRATLRKCPCVSLSMAGQTFGADAAALVFA